MTNVTDCFVRRNGSCMEWILHAKRSCLKLFSATIMMKISLLPHSARYSSVRGIQTIASVESGNGFRLHLYSEVKAISARLGGKYKHIEKLINFKNNNNDL